MTHGTADGSDQIFLKSSLKMHCYWALT